MLAHRRQRPSSRRSAQFAAPRTGNLVAQHSSILHRTARTLALPQIDRGNRRDPAISGLTPWLNPHRARRAVVALQTDRDFVPWRFSNAGHRTSGPPPHFRRSKTLYGAITVKADLQSFNLFISLFDQLVTIFSSRPSFDWPPRTVTVKGGRRPSRSDLPLTVTSTAAGYAGRQDNSEGSSSSGAEIAPQPCIRSIREDRTMMQSCASAAKLRGGRSILHSGLEAMVFTSDHRHLGSSSADPSMGRQAGCPVASPCCRL